MTWVSGVSVFSGRPDPSWAIGEELANRLVELWSSLPPAADEPAPRPPPLGYRGCFLLSADGRRWSAYREAVRFESEGQSEERRDERRAFEELVLGSAPDGTLPSWIRD